MTDPMIAYVVSSGLATLHEVNTVYSLEDIYRLYEILKVRDYNHWKAQEVAKQRAKIKKFGVR